MQRLPTKLGMIAVLFALSPTIAKAEFSRPVQLLQQYVQIDTTNPPGYTTTATQWLAKTFASFGVSSTTVGPDVDKPTFVATIPGSQLDLPAVVLMHHMDVVPAGTQQWQHPPFSGAVVADEIWGRGTFDTKSLGILQLEAIRSILANGQPTRTIHYLGVPDEETQGPAGAGWLVENYLDQLGPIAYVLNEGAVGNIGVIDPGVLLMPIQTAEKQPLWLHVTATGESGHGSAPHDNNAADALIRALQRLQNTELRAEITPTVAAMLKELATTKSGINAIAMNNAQQWPFDKIVAASMAKKSPQTRSSTRNTCSLTELKAGVKANVIPAEARATLDCRLLPSEKFEDFKQKLLQIFNEPSITLSPVLESASGPASNPDSPVVAAIKKATKAVYPTAIVAPYMSAGYTDSAFFRQAGLQAFGFNPIVLTPLQLKGIHNVDERIGLDGFNKAVEIYTNFLMEIVQ